MKPPSPALIVAVIALFVALGGTSYAVTQLPKNSVGTEQIKNGSILASDFKSSEVGKLKGPAGTAGATGPPGATGPAGATGPVGASAARYVVDATGAIVGDLIDEQMDITGDWLIAKVGAYYVQYTGAGELVANGQIAWLGSTCTGQPYVAVSDNINPSGWHGTRIGTRYLVVAVETVAGKSPYASLNWHTTTWPTGTTRSYWDGSSCQTGNTPGSGTVVDDLTPITLPSVVGPLSTR